jgi:hypothetical protein
VLPPGGYGGFAAAAEGWFLAFSFYRLALRF